MDYRINNEAIIACVIAQILKREACEPLRISLFIPLLMENGSIEKTRLTLSYKEYLPIVVNSVVMLKEGGAVKTEDNQLMLTDRGEALCQEMLSNPKSKRLNKIVDSIDTLLLDARDYKTNELYNKLEILL